MSNEESTNNSHLLETKENQGKMQKKMMFQDELNSPHSINQTQINCKYKKKQYQDVIVN